MSGGSESLCLQVAKQLSAGGPVDIVTTCALDYVTWANHYPPGEDHYGSVRILRFPVAQERSPPVFSRLSEAVRRNKWTIGRNEEEGWMREQGPWSPALLSFLQSARDDYDAFVFFTYLYATSYFGLPLVADRAYLVPTAHDEWMLQLQFWESFFRLPQGFVFSSSEERSLLRRRFPLVRLDGPVLGAGVEPPATTKPDAFRSSYGVSERFVLCLGRVEPAKGIPELLEFFAAYQRSSGDQRTRLLLVGRPLMELPPLANVRSLGVLPEQDKWDALAAADVLVVPSQYESLSLVCAEAWAIGKPVLVTAAADVLVGQCLKSQGGLWYHDAREFGTALGLLLGDDRLRLQLGAQGRAYVERYLRWSTIVSAYRRLLSRAPDPAGSNGDPRRDRAHPGPARISSQ